MSIRHLMAASVVLALAAPAAFAAAPVDMTPKGHAHPDGNLMENEMRCTEPMRRFDVAARSGAGAADPGHAIALRNDGARMRQYRDYSGGIGNLNQALAMLGQTPYGNAR